MGKFLTVIMLVISLVAAVTAAADFKVEVIKVFAGGGGPMFRPGKWSPDGFRMAFFSGQKLMLADTLGRAEEVYTIDFTARPFEWISDTEIVVFQRQFGRQPYRQHRLSIITLSGVETVLEADSVPRGGDGPFFSVPRRTPSGVVYYRSDTKASNQLNVLTRPEKGRPLVPSDHFYVTTVGANLCRMSLDEVDTSVFLPGKYAGVVVSNDYSMLLAEGPGITACLYDLKTGLCDTIYPPQVQSREDVYCGIMGYEFNPINSNQIVYFATCDERYGHNTTRRAICLYDHDTKQSAVLSPMTESEHELSPMFSPDGRFLTFLSQGSGVCLARLEVR